MGAYSETRHHHYDSSLNAVEYSSNTSDGRPDYFINESYNNDDNDICTDHDYWGIHPWRGWGIQAYGENTVMSSLMSKW